MSSTFAEMLRRRAEATPDRPAFEFELSETERRTVTYSELDRGARAVAALIQERGGPGSTVLLLHQPGPDYVTAFFGCLYSGAIAVPVYPPLSPRGLERVRAVAADSGAGIALVDTATLGAVYEHAGQLDIRSSFTWVTSDDVDLAAAAAWRMPRLAPDDVAVLQYTSGSTGTPKGVMLSHANIMRNSAAIARTLGLDETSRGVSWLPPYHDMGLIGGILQPVYAGFPCTLLSPLTFLYKPLRWLQALSRTRATITAGPDFGYAETVRRTTAAEREELDLSALRHALVGAEPVRRTTLAEFADAFRVSEFRSTAFYPCYGLAEATLFVAGGAYPEAGPVSLKVTRSGLSTGRVAVADGGHTAELTGCGWAHQEDLALIVDPVSGEPLPPGVVGEVWVSGPSVARGYWRRPEETAATFGAAVPGHPGRTFLRTGDLGFRHEGQLYITGRIKDLIIVRGRNHYPADIELTAEQAHPLLQPGRGAAFAVDDGTAEKVVLVHEVLRQFTAENGPSVIAAVREAVAAVHGLSLSDVVLVRLGSVPRTSSGKIRRAECRARWRAAELNVVASMTAEAAEQAATIPGDLAALIAAALESDRSAIAANTPLVSQGLDSLRAVRLSAALKDARGIAVPIAWLLDDLTPADLGRLRAEDTVAARPSLAQQSLAITPAQERIWLLDQMGAGGAYHVAGGLRLRGTLDPALLEKCVAGILAGIPVLRSAFKATDDGTLSLSVRPLASPFRIPRLDASELGEDDVQHALRRLAAESFDLVSGPLVRLLLLELGPQEWLLGLAAHHIVLDGWSIGLLLRCLGEAYQAGGAPVPLPAGCLPCQSWSDESIGFWREQLDGAQAVDLPTDYPVQAVPSWRGASLPLRIPATLVERLRATAAECSATPFMVLLGAFGVLLGRWSGQDDLIVGTVVSGRDYSGGASVIGMLANTLPIRMQIQAADFRTVIARVRARCLAAYAHSAVPFDEIARATAGQPTGGRAPLVRALLVLQNLPIEPWEARGVRAEPFEFPAPGAQFELSVHFSANPDGSLTGHAVYATDIFEEQTIAGLLSGLPVLLDAALARPTVPVADLPLLSAAEGERIARTAGDGGVAAVEDGLVHELIARAAQASPGATAVAWDDGELSYGGLDARARRLAARLRTLGVIPDQPVAVCLPRSPELVVAVYGVLLAGGAYLPLDTSYPPARLAQQISDAGTKVLIGAVPGLELPDDVIAVGPHDQPGTLAPPAAVWPGNLANVLYTSGSTGQPKAVMTTHAALANRLVWMSRNYGLEPGEAVLHKTPVSFDVAGWELLWPLISGATVVLARPEGHRDPYYLADLIVRRKVTTCHFVPSMLHAFLEEPAAARCSRTLRRVLCSGEELTPAVAARFGKLLPGVQLHNLYGPTEAAIEVTAQPVGRAEMRLTRIPIGRAIAGTHLYVLDPAGRVVPSLATGELHIGGLAPGRGYLGRPGLTAERFVPDPYHPGARLYRTGDRARMLPDGTFEYLGRLDRQLKIRGQRVEPAEIEAVLNQHPLVGVSVVDARPCPAGPPRLLAWVVPAGPQAPASDALREYLEERIPRGMIPAAITVLRELPVGPNGKLDRSALPEPVLSAPDEERIAPRTAVERKLAEIWSEVLGLSDLSVTADFYQLGGHSLMATRVAVRVRAAFGADLPVGELIGGSPTIERLAELVQRRQIAQADRKEVDAVLEWLSGLSDEQVTGLLAGEWDS